MPDPRGLYLVINGRRHGWRPYGDDQGALYRSTDAEPLPVEPQHERSTVARRVVLRLRMLTLGSRPRSGPATGA
jgi:hypothetical protein